MGSVNIDNTGSGADVTLSSDGTNLLLDGTAIGGGGGSPDLYADNDVSATAPTASGDNSVAIGNAATASGADSFSFGIGTASGTKSLTIGEGTNSGAQAVLVGWAASSVTGSQAVGLGRYVRATATGAMALGSGTLASASYSSAIGRNSSNASSQAVTGSGAMALGGSYASGADSLAAAIANNTSSYGATGANAIAMGQQSKATGGQSTAIGNFAQATNTSAAAIGGYLPRAEGNSSLALGTYSQAEAAGSVAVGYRTKAKTTGKLAFNAAEPTGGMGTANGDNQRGMYVLRRATTDATQTVLSGNGGTVAASNSWVPENNSAHAFSGTIIARQDATDGNDYAAWEVKGAIMRASNAASTVVGMAIINSLYHTSGASAWDVAIEANTTLGSCEVKVTGAASTNIQWVATIDTSEVVNA